MLYYSIDWVGCTSNGHFGNGSKLFVDVVEAVDTFIEFIEREKDGYISFWLIDGAISTKLMYHNPRGIETTEPVYYVPMNSDIFVRMGDRG